MKTRQKKLTAMVAAAAMAAAMFVGAALPAKAATVVETGKCGPTMNYTVYDNGDDTYSVEITGSGMMNDWSNEDSPFRGQDDKWRDKITTVTVKEGVLSIGSRAFYGYASWNFGNLRYVYLPEGLKYINERAFNNTGITYIKIPSTVEFIGGVALPTNHMNVLTLPKNLKELAPIDTENLKDVYYPGTEAEFNEIKINNEYFSGYSVGKTYDSLLGKMHYGAVDPMYDTYGPDEGGDAAKGFTDVPAGAYYKDAVDWAVSLGITSGTSATTFGSNDDCTRGQIMTFLWRANGQGSGAAVSFRDVANGAYYFNAVSWAVANNVTSGTSATTFSPDQSCTREQAMTFLWRAAGCPAASGSVPFRDVSAASYSYQAIQWAVSNGITSGTSATTFGPTDICTRAQIITFLYRAEN